MKLFYPERLGLQNTGNALSNAAYMHSPVVSYDAHIHPSLRAKSILITPLTF